MRPSLIIAVGTLALGGCSHLARFDRSVDAAVAESLDRMFAAKPIPPSASDIAHNARLQELGAAAAIVTVDTTDGISEVEALRIASDWFGRGCGGPDLPEDHGDVWIVPLIESYFAVHMRDVVIDKVTGKVTVVDVGTGAPNKPVETTSLARPEIRESYPLAVALRSVSHG